MNRELCITSPKRSSFHISAGLESYPFRKNWFPARKGPEDTFTCDLGKAGPDRPWPKSAGPAFFRQNTPKHHPFPRFKPTNLRPDVPRGDSPPSLYRLTP